MKAEEWDAWRAKWKSCMLSIPVSILDSNSENEPDRVWVQAFNRRQTVRQEHESLVRTAMQTALEIDQFRVICENQPGCKGRLQPAQLAEEFVKLGLASVQGGTRKDGEDDGRLTANLISTALAVKKGILGSPRAVEILLEMEAVYGTRSPFHHMSRLHAASTKPSTPHMRDWVLECLWDCLQQNAVEAGDISKSSLTGDKHHVGMVALFELKKKARAVKVFLVYQNCWCFPCQVYDHFFDILLPKSGMSEPDRQLLKEKTWKHDVYRANSGDGDCSWMARLSKSAIETFHLLEARLLFFFH